MNKQFFLVLLICAVTTTAFSEPTKGWYSISDVQSDGSHQHIITTENNEPASAQVQEAAGYFFKEYCPHCNPEIPNTSTKTYIPSYDLWESPVPCFVNFKNDIQNSLNQRIIHVNFDSSAHHITQYSQNVIAVDTGITTKGPISKSSHTQGNIGSLKNYKNDSSGDYTSANISLQPMNSSGGSLQEQALTTSSAQYSQNQLAHQVRTVQQDLQACFAQITNPVATHEIIQTAVPPAPKNLTDTAHILCGPKVSTKLIQAIKNFETGVYKNTRQNHHLINHAILVEAVQLGQVNSNGILPCFTQSPWITYAKLSAKTSTEQHDINYLLLCSNLGYDHNDSRYLVAERALTAHYYERHTNNGDEKKIYDQLQDHSKNVLLVQKDLPHTASNPDDILALKNEWQTTVDHLHNITYQPTLYKRLEALEQDYTTPHYSEKQQYILPVDIKSFLLSHGVAAGAYEFLQGSHLQHQLHREVLDIATSSYIFSKNALITAKCPEFPTVITQLCNASLHANQKQEVVQAAEMNDCSFAWLQYAQDIANGVALGLSDLKEIVVHPITTIANSVKALATIAYLSNKAFDHTVKIYARALPAALGFRTEEFLQDVQSYQDVLMYIYTASKESFKHLTVSTALTESSRFISSIFIPALGIKALQTSSKILLPLALKIGEHATIFSKTLPTHLIRAAGVSEKLVASSAELQECMNSIGHAAEPFLPALRDAALYENPEYLQSVLSSMKDVGQVTKFAETTKNFSDLSHLHESQQTYLKYIAQLYDSIGAEMKALSQEAVTFTSETGEIYQVKEWTMWHPHVGEMPTKISRTGQISGAHFDYNNIYSKLYDLEITKPLGNNLAEIKLSLKGLSKQGEIKTSSILLNAPRPDIILQDVINTLKTSVKTQSHPARNGVFINFTRDNKIIYEVMLNTTTHKIHSYYRIPTFRHY